MYSVKTSDNLFESIKHIDDFGNEYWFARELMPLLDYKQWRRFESVIDKSKIACKKSNGDIDEQFANVGKLSINGNGGKNVRQCKMAYCYKHY